MKAELFSQTFLKSYPNAHLKAACGDIVDEALVPIIDEQATIACLDEDVGGQLISEGSVSLPS